MQLEYPSLIIGRGYLGERLLALLNDQPCWYTRRSPASAEGSLVLDINNDRDWKNLNILSDWKGLTIYFMVPTSKVDTGMFPGFIDRLNRLNPRRGILVSSTVVYGNSERVVDADSDVELATGRAVQQYNIERLWLDNLVNASIVRLAGIYGPDRIIGRNSVVEGGVIDADPDGWLNLIHVEDAAALLKQCSELERFEKIELGCDGKPVLRNDYYSSLAGILGKPVPVFQPGKGIRGTGRRCDPTLTVKRTGWNPRHVDYESTIIKLEATSYK